MFLYSALLKWSKPRLGLQSRFGTNDLELEPDLCFCTVQSVLKASKNRLGLHSRFGEKLLELESDTCFCTVRHSKLTLLGTWEPARDEKKTFASRASGTRSNSELLGYGVVHLVPGLDCKELYSTLALRWHSADRTDDLYDLFPLQFMMQICQAGQVYSWSVWYVSSRSCYRVGAV